MTQAVEETRLADELWDELELAGGAPAPVKVLFATEGSGEAQNAQQFLARLPLPAGSKIHVLTITAGAEWTMPEWFVAGEHAWGEKVSAAAAEALARDGVEVIGTARSGSVSYEIIEAAEEFNVDLVAVGSKGLTGLAGFFLGSVARNVAKHVRRPVLVAREVSNDLKRVVLAVDESAHAEAAARFAARLPLPKETQVDVLYVLRPRHAYAMVAPEFIVEYEQAVRDAEKAERETAEKLVGRICERLGRHGKIARPVLFTGDPADEILKHAEAEGADLIVAGARGVSLIEGLLVGSVAERVLKQAHCSVLLVR